MSDAELWFDFMLVILSPLGRRVRMGVVGRLREGVPGAEWKRRSIDSDDVLREGASEAEGDGSGEGYAEMGVEGNGRPYALRIGFADVYSYSTLPPCSCGNQSC